MELEASEGEAARKRPLPVRDSNVNTSAVKGMVLFVEDEDSLRLTVTRMLRKRGFQIIEAADGESAVKLFRESHDSIGVVFLDLTLPKRSGPDVLTELRLIRPDTKVVLTSGYSRDTAMAEIGSEVVSGFIRKPYTIDGLAAMLRDALSA